MPGLYHFYTENKTGSKICLSKLGVMDKVLDWVLEVNKFSLTLSDKYILKMYKPS